MNLLGLFKKKESVLFSDKATSKIVNNARIEANDYSDRLLESAESLLKSIEEDSVKIKEKAKLLEELGFTGSKLVQEVKELEKSKRLEQEKADKLKKAKEAYPNYKYISEEDLLTILNKNKMVIGNISKFNGYVPEANLLDIKKFYEDHPDDKYVYSRTFRRQEDYKAAEYQWRVDRLSSPNPRVSITKAEYDKIEVDNNPYYPSSLDNKGSHLSTEDYKSAMNNYDAKLAARKYHTYADLKPLNICCYQHEVGEGTSPKEDKHSEPIIVMETSQFSDYAKKGYIIVTAWGDDLQYDPLIYNDLEIK